MYTMINEISPFWKRLNFQFQAINKYIPCAREKKNLSLMSQDHTIEMQFSFLASTTHNLITIFHALIAIYHVNQFEIENYYRYQLFVFFSSLRQKQNYQKCLRSR